MVLFESIVGKFHKNRMKIYTLDFTFANFYVIYDDPWKSLPYKSLFYKFPL